MGPAALNTRQAKPVLSNRLTAKGCLFLLSNLHPITLMKKVRRINKNEKSFPICAVNSNGNVKPIPRAQTHSPINKPEIHLAVVPTGIQTNWLTKTKSEKLTQPAKAK